MDPRLLRHYETELSYLREMGADFADAFPKIAARLGIDGLEVLDPFVERLIESAAFLAARVQLELEQQYPNFTSHLLEVIYPHYQSPIPSMMIAELQPDMANGALAAGVVLERGTELRSTHVAGTQTACRFRTTSELTLWPLEIAEAEYVEGRGDLVAAGVARPGIEARAGLRLRLRRGDGGPLSELPLEALTVFIDGKEPLGWRLHAVLATETTALVARSTDRRDDWVLPLRGGVVPRGFSTAESALPTPPAAFDGYRLLQEYFTLPHRFLFLDLTGLSPALIRAPGSEVDLYILLEGGNPDFAGAVRPEHVRLNCVPAANLFERRCDRAPITLTDTEQHVVVDRTAPLDYEVHTLLSVTGISGEGQDDVAFLPFYALSQEAVQSGAGQAYFTQRRKHRQRTERERQRGTRSDYLGSETFVSLVDADAAPWRADLAQLAVRALVTNRDLPLLLTTGAADIFHLPEGGPVTSIRTPVAPTAPRPAVAQGEMAWRLISHLSLNYLSIADTDGGSGAAALKELLRLYVPAGDRVAARQVDGVSAVSSRPVVRRITDGGLSAAVRGLLIEITVDERSFEGTSAYHLGAALAHFFRKYVTVNSFTETVLVTDQRGEIARWAPTPGLDRLT